MKNVFMVHVGPSGAVFVKELEFFREQGGFEQDWGKAWTPVIANDIEDARTKRAGKFNGPPATVVCLCGSTRFMDAFQKAKYDETLAGRIVLSIGCDTKSDGELFKGPEGDAIKIKLDELHKRKIDLADEVLILNVGGYIGSSTRSELEYAQKYGKKIRFLEPM